MSTLTIQDAFVKLEKVEGRVDNLQIQDGIFESRFESERGTVSRRHIEFKEELKEIKDLIYNRDTGIAFELDRLKQKDKKRDEQKKQLIALWIAVGSLALKIIYDLINKT